MSGGRGGRGGRGNGGGEGRGNGDGQGGRGNGGGPVPAFTVTEDMRINFTRQLLKLRDDAVTEVVFPNTLTNIERKFLHKLSEELGLKSRSHGKDENRRITVSKKEGATVGSDAAAPDSLKVFEMQGRTKKALASAFGDPASFVQANAGILDSVGAAGDVEHRGRAAASASSEASAIQASHEQMQAAMKKSPQFKSTQAKRASLPAASYKDDLCKLVRENQTVLVSGETGCGKTTQVPQYLLDDPVTGPTCRIVVTQPRRLSAISVAERIASERCEKLGGSIGYNIRLEQEKSKNTQVLFVTPGVLLRKLQNDPLLEEFTHIVIDEAHERDRFTEFLIMMVRDICLKRASMKLILMSATMQIGRAV